MRIALYTCPLLLVVTACHRSPSQEEIERVVDKQLEARGVPAPKASGAAAPTGSPMATKDAAGETTAFLAHLEDLMRDFQPNVQLVDDPSDVFRCITSDALTASPELASSIGTLKTKVDAARREHEQSVRELYAEVYPVAFRVDYDWATRKTEPIAPVYDCYNVTTSRWTRGLNAVTCTQNPMTAYASFAWKPRIPGKPSHFLYSGGDTAPTAPPELMRRIDGSKILLPGRLACRVSNVTIEKDQRSIACESSGTSFVVRVEGDLPVLNVGDVITAPLAGVHRNPNGVLWRQRYGKTYGWVIDADAKTITVETKAQCPSLDEVLAAGK